MVGVGSGVLVSVGVDVGIGSDVLVGTGVGVEVTDGSAAGSQEMASSSEALGMEAAALNTLIEHFKTVANDNNHVEENDTASISKRSRDR